MKNLLYRDVREFNVHLLILFGVLFISIVGACSYALFSTEAVSDNNISISVG